MRIDSFSQQIEAFSQQVFTLFERLSPLLESPNENGALSNGHETNGHSSSGAKVDSGSAGPKSSRLISFNSEVAAMVLKELGFAVEELQVAVEEIRHQDEALTASGHLVALQQQRYDDLFRFAPQPYLITDLYGKIEAANPMAAQLFDVPLHYLTGKPLIVYLSAGSRQCFSQELERRKAHDYFQDWELTIESRSGNRFVMACSVVALRNLEGEPTAFQWAMRDVSDRKRLEALLQRGDDLDNGDELLLHGRTVQLFGRRNIISHEPQTIWYVVEGLVKLTTLTDQNKEVLLGLLGPGSPFGAFLTSLSLHEAMALSDVKLVAISLSEVFASPQLAQILFAKTAHRLRRAEMLLAISGEASVEQRLVQLLKFLKEEIGQPVDDGHCLAVRLTHEDLASACCTTRVTVTRLLGKLQQEGSLRMDERNFLVVTDQIG